MNPMERPAAAGFPSRGLVVPAGAPERSATEDFIRQSYQRHFGARLDSLPAELFVLRDAGGPLAAAGLRCAESERLFLEAYLDEPIERAIARHQRMPIDRADIVEVANLAIRGPGDGRRLIEALTHYLHRCGFRWVVFTATRRLRNTFHRLGLEPVALAPADPRRLGRARCAWGSYYQSAPQVMYGRIGDGYRRFEARS